MNNIRRDGELAAGIFSEQEDLKKHGFPETGYYTWSAWDASGREWKFQKDVSIAGPDDKKCQLTHTQFVADVYVLSKEKGGL